MKIKVILLFLAIISFSEFSYGQLTCGVDAGVGGTICPGDSIQLSGTALPDTISFRYFWSPSAGLSDTSVINPMAKPTETTVYILEATAVDSTELVVNGDFSAGATGFSSEYRDSTSVWNEGTYSVDVSPQNVHPGFAPCGDHTTGSDSFMVVNGNSLPNSVIWSQTISITPFTEYEFSSWVTNVLFNAPNLPLLQFSINGQLLDQPFTSVQAECEWSQFFTTWFSDTSTTATIEIVNKLTIPTGNDFGIDDISFRGICRSVDSLTVNVYEEFDPMTYGLGEDQLVCDEIPLSLITSVPGANDFVWQDNSTRADFSVTSAGTYYVTLRDENNCEFSDTINITEGASPQITLPSDTTICEDNTVTFNVYDPSATSYLWRGPSVYFLQNDPTDSIFTATFEGIYEVDISNNCGTLTQIIDLKTEDCVCAPFVPNSFTPNNDGNNDALQIFTGCDIMDLQFSVFNRWGERVFYTEDINEGWDGTFSGSISPTGVYIYKLEYTSANFKGEVVPNIKYGDITLVK
jgi:gliding motility-associated-like protein